MESRSDTIPCLPTELPSLSRIYLTVFLSNAVFQSWFGTGYGYGIWIGALFALNFTVVPITARKWKLDMGLSGKQYSKVRLIPPWLNTLHNCIDFLFCWQDESRALAMSFFPALSSQLKRKKDHGTILVGLGFVALRLSSDCCLLLPWLPRQGRGTPHCCLGKGISPRRETGGSHGQRQ